MFSVFSKKQPQQIMAVVDGICKNLSEVKDDVFSVGLIGKGIAIEPKSNIIKAPFDGKLSAVFPTGHAFGLTDSQGLEYLIHIGIDTVTLKGKGFKLLVEQDKDVKIGDPLVEVDWSVLAENDLISDVLVLVSSAEDQYQINNISQPQSEVKASETVLFECKKLAKK